MRRMANGNLNLKGLATGNYSYKVIDKIACLLNDSVIVNKPSRFVRVQMIKQPTT